LLIEGKMPQAAEALKARLQTDPHNAGVRCLLGTVLSDAGAPDKGAEQAELVLRDDPDCAEAHQVLSTALARQQRTQEAVAHARRAVELAPGRADGYENLAGLLLEQQRFDEAIRAAREGLAVVPFDPKLRLTLGRALTAASEPAAAEAEFDLMAGMQADHAEAQCQAAMAFQVQRYFARAIARYNEALRLKPDFADALANLAWIRAANAQPQFRDGAEAVRLAERACSLTQNRDVSALATLAVAYAEAKRFDEAVAAAGRARDLALAVGKRDQAENNQRLVELFKTRQPYHEPGQ